MKRLSLVTFCCVLATVAIGSPVAGDVTTRPAPAIRANDNRVAAGQLARHELRLALDAVWSRWYPDGPKGYAVPIQGGDPPGRPDALPT